MNMRKECAKGACGVYTAPVLPQVLAEVFEGAGCLNRLENFTSRFGAEFYGLPLNDGTITLTRTEWVRLNRLEASSPSAPEPNSNGN